MAITRQTQKDIGSYEAKFLGPFTMRQSIFFGVGAVISGFFGYCAYKTGADIQTIFMIIFLIMAPFVLFGWKKMYGMKMEDFLISYYFYHFKAPAIRKFEIESTLDKIPDVKPEETGETEEKSKKNKTKKQSAATHKEDPDYPSYK